MLLYFYISINSKRFRYEKNYFIFRFIVRL